MLAAVLLLPRVAYADATSGLDPYEEFGKHLRAAQAIAPLSDNAFGDRISLYNGATEFDVTDFAIPGNNALPVALGRRFTVDDRRMDPGYLGGFGDWDLEVPYIEAVVTTDNGWTLGDGSSARCSDQTSTLNTSVPGMSGPVVAPLNIIWDGDQLHIPGMGDQELLVNNQSKSPADASASTWKWVTTSNWKVGCLGATANGYPGEAFVAVSPTGTTYTFNWVVVHTAPTIFVLTETDGTIKDNIYADRERVFMLATKVEDRFGNTVTYSYNGSNQLTGIASSDGRSIALTWSGSTIASASSALGTWHYGYGTDSQGRTVLTSVTRPDNSKWTYTITSGALETYKPSVKQCSVSDPCPTVHCQLTPYENTGSFTYVIGAPSGADATFSFQYLRNYRYGVPLSCNDGNPDHAYPTIYTFYDNFSLVSKQITGPGLPTMTWTYDTGGIANDQSETAPGYFSATAPYDPNTLVYLPGGSCGTGSDPSPTYNVIVTGPVSITKYAFGKGYGCDDGRLYGTEVEDLSGNVLQTTTSAFVDETAAPNEPFASIAGVDQLGNDIHPTANRNRPLVSTQVVRDGATFTTAINSFDDFARATSETESSTLGYSKADTASYQDDLNQWVLGLATSTATNGITSSQTTYTSADLPYQHYVFGKLVSIRTWNSDGTLASVEDGDNNVTTLLNWYRGLPQTVGFADGTSESAVVNAAGWITALTTQTEYGPITTTYAYDAMGRLSQISYPAGDDVGWNPTLLSFTQVAGSEFGIPAGHWKQVVQTGNDVAVTYFDAFWRPLVTEHYDAGNSGGTLSQTVTSYDAGGRAIFTSYPTASATSYTQSLPGTHTTYDALDRVTLVSQDSELGALPTTTTYLSGFQTEVTDPRGYSTITSYQAYGEPTTQWPVSISAPLGELTTIQRDVFGKPLSITRTGTAQGSPSLTRYYVYDGYQQLCKRIEPENGATAFAYDGAGNLSWSAAGLDLPDTGSCDTSTAQSSGRVASRTYDKRNRLLTVSYADASSNASFDYYPDGLLQTETVSNGGTPVTTNYSYDKRRLLTQETLSISGTSPFTLTYGHDANGHLASTTYPDGRTVGYSPNALGQPTAAGAYASGATYYPNGAIASFTYGSGAVHTMTENERGLPSRNTDALSGTAGMDFGGDYDGDGNVAAITDYLPGNVGNIDMSYDALDRLTEADSPMFGSGSADKALYQYDVLDNLLSASVGNYSNLAYSYNADGQRVALVEPGTNYVLHYYAYDVQGNLASKDGESYQFDMANRLRNVPGVASYLYDAAGRRVQKDETLYGGILLDSDYSKAGQLLYQWQPSTQSATDYIYLGDTLVARVVNVPTPPPSVPAAPASITVTPTTGDTGNLSVSWAASSGTTSYVLWQNANNGGADFVSSESTTSANITGLASGSYVYQVQACNSSGCSGFATSGTVKVIPAVPSSITVPAYSFGTSIPVSWQASPLANNYVLEEYPYNGGWGVAWQGTSTSDTVTLPGSGTYQFQVAACGAGGCSAYKTSGNVIVTLPPSLSASATSSISGTFTLSWNSVPTATSYTLSQNGTSVPSSGTSWSSSALPNGTYTYTVQSCNAYGCSGASNAVTVVVNHIQAPTLSTTASNSTSGTFTLSWNTVTNATSYQLYQSGTSSPVYNASGTSWTSSALPNGTYTYTVYGCNGSTCGFVSNAVTVAVLHVPPAPSLSANETSSPDGSFSLSWNTTTAASTYDLYQNGTSVYDSTGTAWSTSGEANGTYTYTVDACNASGCSAASNAVTVTVLLVPPASSLSTSFPSSTTGTFTLNWTSESNSTRYQLNQSLNGGSWTAVYNSTGLSFTTNHLASGTYTYVVYACDQSACAPPSNSVQVIVSPIPIAPPSMSAPSSVPSGVGFGVSWGAVSGATSYTVRWTNLATGRVATSTTSSTSAVVTISLPDTYQLAVQACDASGCSGWTNAPNTTTVNSKQINAVPATGSSP